MLSSFLPFFLSSFLPLANNSQAASLTDIRSCLNSLSGKKGNTPSVCGRSVDLNGARGEFVEAEHEGMDGYFRFQENGPIEFIGVNRLELINKMKSNESIAVDILRCSIEHHFVLHNGELDKRYFYVSYSNNSHNVSGKSIDSSQYKRRYMSIYLDANVPKSRCRGSFLKELRGEDVKNSAIAFLKKRTLQNIDGIKRLIESKKSVGQNKDKNCKDYQKEIKVFLSEIDDRLKRCDINLDNDPVVNSEIVKLKKLIHETKLGLQENNKEVEEQRATQ